MKPHVILIFSTDSIVEFIAREVIPEMRHGLRVIRSSPEAFRQLHEGCDDIDLAIIDLDPGMHGAALLEAAGDRLPVLVLTSLEENYMRPVAKGHGARSCLTKPFNPAQLRAAIEELLPTPARPESRPAHS